MVSFVEATLVNEPFGDPGLYLDFRFGRRAMLFDLGDLHDVPVRKLLRVSHAFVSHAHLDHFSGFDRLLRVRLHGTAPLGVIGPPGMIERVKHKLSAYTWNLIAGQEPDFVIAVAEYDGETLTAAAEFHSARAFRQSAAQPPRLPSGIALDDPDFEIRATALDHGVTSLAFALREKLRVNVWKDRLVRMGLAVGPWLKAAKAAIREGKPDATPIVAVRAGKQQDAVALRLGEVREAFRVGPGESLAYVVDAAYHASNAARIVDLVRGVDTLFIETVFLEEDREIAAQRRHLTAAQAGSLARRARARRLVPFHLSPRYSEREDRVRQEAYDAFAGTIDAAKPA